MLKLWPSGCATGKVRRPSKSSRFILGAQCISELNFMLIHPKVVEIFQSGLTDTPTLASWELRCYHGCKCCFYITLEMRLLLKTVSMHTLPRLLSTNPLFSDTILMNTSLYLHSQLLLPRWPSVIQLSTQCGWTNSDSTAAINITRNIKIMF